MHSAFARFVLLPNGRNVIKRLVQIGHSTFLPFSTLARIRFLIQSDFDMVMGDFDMNNMRYLLSNRFNGIHKNTIFN